MHLLAMIILGGLAGWVASMFAGTNKRMGVVANVIVGMVGSVVGGLLFNFFGGVGVTGFNLYSFVVAVVGSVLVLAIAKRVFKF